MYFFPHKLDFSFVTVYYKYWISEVIFSSWKLANRRNSKNIEYHPTCLQRSDLHWSCNELCIGQGLNLAQMCFDRIPNSRLGQSTMNIFTTNVVSTDRSRRSYSSNICHNSMLFTLPHQDNGPLSKCKLFIDSHGIVWYRTGVGLHTVFMFWTICTRCKQKQITLTFWSLLTFQ